MATELAALAVNIETNGAQNAIVALGGIDKAGTAAANSVVSLESVTHNYTKTATTATRSAVEGGTGLGRLERAVSSVALATAGLEGPVGRVGEALLRFGAGGVVTLAVAAGVALITTLWKHMGAEADALKRKSEDLAKAAGDSISRPASTAEKYSQDLAEGRRGLKQWQDTLADVRTEMDNFSRSGLTASQARIDSWNRRIEEADRQVHIFTDRVNVAQAALKDLGEIQLQEQVQAWVRIAQTQELSHAELVQVAALQARVNQELAKGAALSLATRANFEEMRQSLSKILTPNLPDILTNALQPIQIGREIGQALGSAITQGVSDIFSGKDPLSAFGGAIAHGLAAIMRMVGEAWIAMGITSSISPLSGPGAIAAGAALVAAASALDSAVQSDIKTVGTGGGSSSGGFSTPRTGSLPTDYAHYTIGGPVTSRQSAYPSATGPALQVVVIGPDDPTAQRQIMRLISNAQRRGL